MIRFSAPAKIHLLGEHSVSYGKPALLTAINLRLTLTLRPAKKRIVTIKEIIPAQIALEKAIQKKFSVKKIPPYSIEISSQFPIGSGLGSSSAISVTLTASLLKYLKIKADKETIYELGTTAENVFHGKSSGGDLAAVTYGGLLWFRKELEDLKIIKPLNFTIKPTINNFFLINSGKPKESTREMVLKVGSLREKKPKLLESVFNSQESLTKQLAIALKNGNQKSLMEAITFGQRNLEKIGAVGKIAKSLIKLVEKSGGAAKILGAGGYTAGSGMILVYHPNPKKLKNLEPIKIKLGREGLKSES